MENNTPLTPEEIKAKAWEIVNNGLESERISVKISARLASEQMGHWMQELLQSRIAELEREKEVLVEHWSKAVFDLTQLQQLNEKLKEENISIREEINWWRNLSTKDPELIIKLRDQAQFHKDTNEKLMGLLEEQIMNEYIWYSLQQDTSLSQEEAEERAKINWQSYCKNTHLK